MRTLSGCAFVTYILRNVVTVTTVASITVAFSSCLANSSTLPVTRLTLQSLSFMEATTLRSEIKAWERAFRSDHGRDPTVQDIKENPAIGTCSGVLSNERYYA